MNITFLMGNGFDVGMKLPSKFKDFFPQYVKDSVNKEKDIRQLSEEIGDNFDTWSDFENQMGEYTSKFDTNTKQKYIAQIRDFEMAFIEYLREQETQLSFDKKEEIAKTMISALTTFSNDTVLSTGSSVVVKNVMKKYAHTDYTYNFITFNYTSVLEKCLECIPDKVVCKRNTPNATKTDRIGRIVNVHGTLDNAPIMGVNDTGQIINEELSKDERFIRYIVKPKSNQLHRTNREVDAATLINSSQIICIYGMALGATDRDWWDKVLTWLSGESSRQLIIFIYDSKFKTTTQFDRIEKEDEIIDRLTLYSKRGINAEKYRDRIHIAVHKNIFEMDLRGSDETKKLHPSVQKIDPNLVFMGDVPPEESGLSHAEGMVYFQKVDEVKRENDAIDMYNESLPQITVV